MYVNGSLVLGSGSSGVFVLMNGEEPNPNEPWLPSGGSGAGGGSPTPPYDPGNNTQIPASSVISTVNAIHSLVVLSQEEYNWLLQNDLDAVQLLHFLQDDQHFDRNTAKSLLAQHIQLLQNSTDYKDFADTYNEQLEANGDTPDWKFKLYLEIIKEALWKRLQSQLAILSPQDLQSFRNE